jgi:hypothetical protein
MELEPLTRKWVETRVNELCKHIQPADGDDREKATVIAGMYMAYPAQRMDETAATARGVAYLAALERFPAWAVSRAVNWWLAGEHTREDENRAFPAAPPQLARLCDLAMHETRAEISGLQSLLTARIERPVDPETRKKVGAEIVKLAESFGGKQERVK